MAGGINFSGIGSGLDFSKLTEAIMAERARPLTQLQARSADYAKRGDALKQLNARLAALADSVDALTDRDLGTGRLASSSAASIVTASSTVDATLGAIDLTVTRLATSLSQSSRVYGAATSAVLAGAATSATFELRLGGESAGVAIAIDETNNTLTGLRDAINEADAGVTATIVDLDGTETQYKLVLNSTATGAAGRVELVETSATGSAADLNLTSLNPPGATVDFSDLDAAFSINGLDVTRATNTVTDAVTGLTFNLKEIGSARVTVSAKTSDLSDKIYAFVSAYNDVQDFIAAQYVKDGKDRPSGVLAGDSTLRAAQAQLREAIGALSTDNGGAFDNFTQIGISRDDAGKLTLDAAVLNDALSDSFSDVQALFSGQADGDVGLANSIYDAVNALSDSITGTVQTAIDGYASSVKRIEQNINQQLQRLNTLRSTLTRQFAAADAAINQLNGQGTSLTTVLKSLEPRNE
ncbi:MAG: flagellar filament capping protein FliD [Blastocatellia bacterium]|nr:flagellar filament capping protein FliD [Blastocatellia bacterium]